MSCASVLKRRRPQAEVTVIEAGNHISFSACGIPYWLGDEVPGGSEELVVVSVEEARHERGLDVRTGARAVDVDASSKTVTVEDGDSREELAYDVLVLAPGVAAVDPFEVGSLENAFTLRHLDDGIQADRILEREHPRTAVVVGGGFVGVETAEAFNRRGIETTLVHSSDTLLDSMVEPELGTLVNERVRRAGVDLRTGQRAGSILREGERAQAVELPEDRLEGDVFVVAVGARPRTELARAAGCSIGPHGGVTVDEKMRTDVPDVYACGDCVAYPHKLTGERVVLPLALHANRSGRIAGETIAGNDDSFPGVLGTAITRFEDLEIARTGLTLAEAGQAGFEAVGRSIESVTRAGYHPASDPIHVHLVAERGSGRVLGGQIVGGAGAGKRIDTIAAAIWKHATCSELEAMDLAYAPPVSPTWEPMAIAGRLAAREAAGEP